ncbi:transposon-transfer assisting family protein [Stomatobaculum longum]|uniref:transposon-transfer assisting family protein n=1 Tax=Stomatobaculum longum TaxID=796942 RepID=UPI0028E84CDC|nr:transposon-transfer assisting family protein [Stomatobaculum longum]
MVFTKDEKTLLILYGEENRSGTLENLFLMRGQLQVDEKALSALTDAVIRKLGGMTDSEFDGLNLLSAVRSSNAGT